MDSIINIVNKPTTKKIMSLLVIFIDEKYNEETLFHRLSRPFWFTSKASSKTFPIISKHDQKHKKHS
jgi:hypothetical protein